MRVLVLAALAGCACDESAATWCTGDGITHCEYGRPTISFCCAFDGCKDVEVDGVATAVCSPTGEPDPRCAGGSGEICAGGSALFCRFGYGSNEAVCAGVCVSPEPGVALCALSADLDPRCTFSDGPRCDGDSILDCSHGYAVSESRCAAPFSTCALEADNLGAMHPRCATPDPDPACADDPPARCAGADIYGCSSGRRTVEHCAYSCYENPIDSMFPEAFCDGPPCSY